jgi:hypothetical protein
MMRVPVSTASVPPVNDALPDLSCTEERAKALAGLRPANRLFMKADKWIGSQYVLV